MAKKSGNHKTQERRKTWHRHLLEWGVILAFAGAYIAVFKLGGCTMGRLPSGLEWHYIVLTTMLAVIVWAWQKKNLKGNFLWYASIGFLSGLMMFLLVMALFLGLNYLFPRSDPYRRIAVVYGKKTERHFRGPTSYAIGLRFDNGRCFLWDGGYKEYECFQKGDVCAVTLYKGLWGSDVVRDVEVISRRKQLDWHILRALFRDERVSHYGLPMSVRRVTGRDMSGEFRIGLLNLATFEEIDDGKRVFVECTWKRGYGGEHEGQRLTYWYEWRENQLYAVDSTLWSTDEEF